MRSYSLALGGFLVSTLLAAPALAVLPTSSAPQIELPDGSEGQVPVEVVTLPVTPAGERGLLRLTADVGAPVRGMFHRHTGVPLRMWGFSVAAPASSVDADAAAKVARHTLETHLQLLAPGAVPADFELTVNHVDGGAAGQRSVGFRQRWRGMPVVGGTVSFRFRNDHLFAIASDAVPSIRAEVPAALVDDAAAGAAARAWVLDGSARATVRDLEGPMVLPIRRNGHLEHHVVVRVRVEAEAPVGLWDVFVDAGTGAPIARVQRLHFETAHLAISAWERSPHYGERIQYAADRVSIDIGASQVSGESAPDGSFSFDGETASGVATLDGSHVRVRSSEGAPITYDFEAAPGAQLVWTSNVETGDAQLNAFVHADRVNEYARSFAPDLAFLDERVNVVVNMEDVCNAYSDGTAIHFYKAGSGCENTARIADVVYHEYGHSLHYHAYLFCSPGQGACIPEGAGGLSEGISDYLAATITGDPEMGRGFFMDDGPLRSVDPDGREHVWPADVVGESHYDGLIIGGALWDLRTALIDDLGEADGIARADWLMFEGIRRAANIPEMYAEVLFADDDDGDLANGTPNECAINSAFGRHGLRPLGGQVTAPTVGAPEQDGYEVALAVQGLSAACGETLSNAYMTWSDPAEPSRGGLVDMIVDGDAVARGTLPRQPAGRSIRFDVRVENDGAEMHFPANAADPTYQLYVGPVTPIACFDFETDPFQAGWSHELLDGLPGLGADDWMWGTPLKGLQSGDPLAPFGGAFVVGQDLAPLDGNDWDGHYKENKHSALVSPTIDVSGFDGVRLQYRRWLGVEDGFFDEASILANWDGTQETRHLNVAWTNYDSGQGVQSSTHHADREWRFHDVDVTPFVHDGQLQLRWEMKADGGLNMGGWTLDDVCVVGVTRPTGATCTPGTPGCPAPADGEGGGSDAEDADGDALDPSADDGCGCEVAGGRGGSTPLALIAGVAALAVVAGRRRRG